MLDPIMQAQHTLRAWRQAPLAQAGAATTIRHAETEERSKNPLRPDRLDDIVGQATARKLLRTAIDATQRRGEPLPHTLLVGPSGVGKSTLSHAVATELGVRVYDLEAPVSFDSLLELRRTMRDGDILKIEEIHQQGVMERRGRQTATQPEVLYAVMEDRVLPTERGLLPFPQITVMGTTTDEGLLPDAFVNRFPLRPLLDPYTRDELWTICVHNARTLGVVVTRQGADVFAGACRGVPRVVNNLVRNATLVGERLDQATAREVLTLNGITEDGLTPDMQAMLTFLLTRGRKEMRDGDVRYQASVSTIAVAIGKSRDSKAVVLRVEPYLIEQGYLQVVAGVGRMLTDAGVARAEALQR